MGHSNNNSVVTVTCNKQSHKDILQQQQNTHKNPKALRIILKGTVYFEHGYPAFSAKKKQTNKQKPAF